MPALFKDSSWPWIAGIAAIVVSPVLQLATGQGVLYALWLAVLMLVVWVAQRLTRREVGIAAGDRVSWLAALAYVAGILACVSAGAAMAHLIDLSQWSATTVARRISLNFLLTFVLALITEEGFFRGALWGSCERAGLSPLQIVVWTSVAFGAWHLAVPLIDPDFAQPLAKVPQYVIGSTAFGVAMALLRLRSGSIIVTSACHALWNALAYTLYGAGGKTGQLGIVDASVWDPERGYAGLALGLVAAALLWWWVRPAAART